MSTHSAARQKLSGPHRGHTSAQDRPLMQVPLSWHPTRAQPAHPQNSRGISFDPTRPEPNAPNSRARAFRRRRGCGPYEFCKLPEADVRNATISSEVPPLLARGFGRAKTNLALARLGRVGPEASDVFGILDIQTAELTPDAFQASSRSLRGPRRVSPTCALCFPDRPPRGIPRADPPALRAHTRAARLSSASGLEQTTAASWQAC